MISHPLFDALIQPQKTLPAHFQQAGVGMPPKLPRLLRYGPIAPPQVGGSQFTGGQVAQPQTSMSHPQEAQGFTPPHYNASNPTAPSLAPFVSTPQGGPGMGGFSPQPSPEPTNPLGPAPTGQTSGLGGHLHQGGYSNAAQVLASLLGVEPSPVVSAPPPTKTGGYYQVPQILQTLMAKKLNLSRGGTRYAE